MCDKMIPVTMTCSTWAGILEELRDMMSGIVEVAQTEPLAPEQLASMQQSMDRFNNLHNLIVLEGREVHGG